MRFTEPQSLTKHQADIAYPSKALLGTMVVNVKDPAYGAVGDGVTDDYPAFQLAYNAIKTVGGTLYIPPGIYYMNTSALGAIQWPPFTSLRTTILGAGTTATTIRLSTNCKTFLYASAASNPNTFFTNLSIRHLTVDANHVTSVGGNQGVVFGGTVAAQFDDIEIDHVDTINVGTLVYSGIERRNVDLNVRGVIKYDSTRYNATNIRITNCRFGRSGGGGNYGVLLQGTPTSTATLTTDPDYRANVYFDNVLIENCTWDSGSIPSGTIYSSCGFMIGGQGWGGRAVVRNCFAKNAADDCYEFDSIENLSVENCHAVNWTTEGFAYNSNSNSQSDVQKNVFVGCTAVTNAGGYAFRLLSSETFPSGQFIFRDCKVYNASSYGVAAFFSAGRFKGLTIKDCLIVSTGTTTLTANGSQVYFNPVEIAHAGDQAKINIDGLQIINAATLDINNTTNPSLNGGLIIFDQVNDATINVRNIEVDWRPRHINGVLHGTISPVLFFTGTNDIITDGFSSDSRGSYNDRYTGMLNDLTVTNGVLGVVTNPTTEKRFYWYANFANSGQTRGVGPLTDVMTYVKAAPGAVIQGYKAGVIGKWNQKYGSESSIGAYVTDDGTNSYLCLDKLINGTRTSLLGTIVNGGAGTITAITSPVSYQSDRGIQLTTRIVSGTSFWIRLAIVGNAIQADYFTASAPTRTSSGVATATAVISGSDLAYIGANTQGFSGMSWVPMDLTATLDDFTLFPMSVIRGAIDNVHVNFVLPAGDNCSIAGVNFNGKGNSSQVRIDGNLAISHVYTHQGNMLTSAVPLAGTDATINKNIRMSDVTYGTTAPTASTVTTPGSGVTYTNTDPYVDLVIWNNGTLISPFVEYSSANSPGTWAQVWTAASDGSVVLKPGDSLRWWYSFAPTITKVPFADSVASTLPGAQGKQGALGPSGDAGLKMPTNAAAETFKRQGVTTTTINPSNQQAYGFAIELRSGQTINWLGFISGNTAASGLSNCWFALCDASLNVISKTNDDAGSGWAANTYKKLNLSTPYSVPSDGLYYLVVVQNATTRATLVGVAGSPTLLGVSPALAWNDTAHTVTNLASAPTTFTPSATPTVSVWADCGS